MPPLDGGRGAHRPLLDAGREQPGDVSCAWGSSNSNASPLLGCANVLVVAGTAARGVQAPGGRSSARRTAMRMLHAAAMQPGAACVEVVQSMHAEVRAGNGRFRHPAAEQEAWHNATHACMHALRRCKQGGRMSACAPSAERRSRRARLARRPCPALGRTPAPPPPAAPAAARPARRPRGACASGGRPARAARPTRAQGSRRARPLRRLACRTWHARGGSGRAAGVARRPTPVQTCDGAWPSRCVTVECTNALLPGRLAAANPGARGAPFSGEPAPAMHRACAAARTCGCDRSDHASCAAPALLSAHSTAPRARFAGRPRAAAPRAVRRNMREGSLGQAA